MENYVSLYLQNQNSLSEIEKREKRAMERKLSEMEEELKVTFLTSTLLCTYIYVSSLVADTHTTHYIYLQASFDTRSSVTVSLTCLDLNQYGGHQDGICRQER